MENILTAILNNPVWLVFTCFVGLAVVFLIMGMYARAIEGKEKSLAFDDAKRYIAILRKAKQQDLYIHGSKSAQDLFDEWDELLAKRKKLSAKRETLLLKKFNLRITTFLIQRGLLTKEDLP